MGDSKTSYKTFIFAGVIIAILSVCSALGNYYLLKTNLEADVEHRINQIRTDMHQIGYGANAAMLSGDAVSSTDKTDHNEQFNNMPTEDLVKLISNMNTTMSKSIQNLRNMSRALDNKMATSQQKMKLFENLVGSNGMAAQKGHKEPSGALPGIDLTKRPKDTNMKVVTKDEKQVKNRQVTSAAEKHIYFSVALTKTLTNIGPNHVIMFDLVYSNEGFGYNVKTGKFNVPATGTYFFMFFVEVINEKGKMAHVDLFVDSKERASARAESWHDGQDVTSANAVVTHLTKGQVVWVQTAANLNNRHNINKGKTTFTGVLLFS